jgi:phosphoglycolate phosphatase-like HAD superfamily hydrolase
VTSSEDVEVSKPEPDLVHVALDAAGVASADAVFVGDSVWDVVAAGRAGVPCVAVLSGGIGAHELAEAGAAAVYDDVAALLAGIDESPLARAWDR